MINRSARVLAIFLLLVNGTAALFGGWSLMIDPTGAELGLPVEWRSRLPFGDYFVPGMLLFVLNGVLSVTAAVATISQSRGHEKFVITQGIVLTLWILIQVVIVDATKFLHFATAGIGLTLLILGTILWINRLPNGVSDRGEDLGDK